jgi:ParB family chromosome partitioning protein
MTTTKPRPAPRTRATARTAKTAAPAATAPVPVPGDVRLELISPTDLVIDANVRLDPALDKEFIEDIAANSVDVPVDAVQAPGGPVRVWDGQRRTLAAVQTGLRLIHVLVRAVADDQRAAEIARIQRQARLNIHRKALTAAEIAGAAQTLFDLDVPAGQVGRTLRLDDGQVEAARKIAKAKLAGPHATEYGLDLMQAAILAEFDDDAEAVIRLADVAKHRPGQLEHEAQRIRDERKAAEAIAAHAAKLAKRGITVTDKGIAYDNKITYWMGTDGQQLTPKTHAKCPGNVVVLSYYHREWDKGRVNETWYCTDPKGNGHKKHRHTSSTAATPAEASAERKRVIETNKAWRSAEKVRRGWLRNFAARPKPPADGVAYVLQTLLACPSWLTREMSDYQGHFSIAADLLGLGEQTSVGYGQRPLVSHAAGKAGKNRVEVIALVAVLTACERSLDVHSWRNPSADVADYLAALGRWGYGLSKVEQDLIAAARAKQAKNKTEDDDGMTGDEIDTAAAAAAMDEASDPDPDLPF